MLPQRLDRARRAQPSAGFLDDVALKGANIVRRLHADEVVAEKVAHQRFMHRERDQQFGGGKRNMEEEPDRVLDPNLAQFGGERDEVIIVDPDRVVVADHPPQFPRKLGIDPGIAFIGGASVHGKARPEVEQGPYHAI